MNITTTYKTNASGAGVIEARSGDRRKTIKYDHKASNAQNHGVAAGALVLSAFPEDKDAFIQSLDNDWILHTDLGGGKHKFVF